jgi:hypothetical protein
VQKTDKYWMGGIHSHLMMHPIDKGGKGAGIGDSMCKTKEV